MKRGNVCGQDRRLCLKLDKARPTMPADSHDPVVCTHCKWNIPEESSMDREETYCPVLKKGCLVCHRYHVPSPNSGAPDPASRQNLSHLFLSRQRGTTDAKYVSKFHDAAILTVALVPFILLKTSSTSASCHSLNVPSKHSQSTALVFPTCHFTPRCSTAARFGE